jgi:tetratricopeptide (TPR) repeat protein
MHLLLERSGLLSATDFQAGERDRLSGEVDTLLRRFGPEIYERNDALRAQVLRHYRLSLERMVKIARSGEAEVIFITPASNLKDSSPFKSQYTDGLSVEDRRKVEALLARAVESKNDAEWTEALEALDAAVRIELRHAELHYRRGRALYALGRHAEAKAAFIRARDEDVCPLRALSPMRAALSEVARLEESPLVDFIALLEEKLRVGAGHTIPGESYFLDHVHPTIEGHRLLAVQLVHEMARLGIVKNAKSLDDQTIASVSERIEARIDPQMRARSLANLAKVLAWAGKIEDAGRLARQALESGVRDPAIESDSAMIVARQYMMDDRMDRARQYYQKALNAEPRNPEVHFQIGLQVMKRRQPRLEMAAGHILFASVFWDGSHREMLHRLLGRIMAQRRRYKAAYKNVLEARRIDPQDAKTKEMLGQLGKILGPRVENLKEPKIALARYSSGNLRRIVQVKPGPNGRFIPDGIWTEWYEGGELKRFVDYADGRPQGVDLTWEPSGRLISED